MVALGPRPAGSAALGEDARLHQEGAVGARSSRRTGVRGQQTPAGPIKMVNLRAMVGGPATRNGSSSPATTTPSCSRNVKFVGANDGGSSAAFLIELGARSSRRAARDADRAAVPRRRRGGPHRVGGSRQSLRQPLLRRRGSQGRDARHDSGARPGRHDRRPRSPHQARVAVHRLADRRHLGRRPAGPPAVRRRGDRGRSTTT